MSINEEFKQSLILQMKSENNGLLQLREFLVNYKNCGMDEESMYRNLEEMRSSSDDETEDVLLELMDFVGGVVTQHYVFFSL